MKQNTGDVRDLFQVVSDLYRTGRRQISESLRNVKIEVAYIATIITRTLGEYDRFLRESSKQGKEYIDMCEAAKKAFKEVREEGETEGENKKEQELTIHFLSKNNRVSAAVEMLAFLRRESARLRRRMALK